MSESWMTTIEAAVDARALFDLHASVLRPSPMQLPLGFCTVEAPGL